MKKQGKHVGRMMLLSEAKASTFILGLLLLLLLSLGLPSCCRAGFQNSNWTGARDLSPGVSLQAQYAEEQRALSFQGSGHVGYHWVITSCNSRPQWVRTLSYTMLHGLLQGLDPTTISIAWCRHYNKSSVPSELYNLRYSKRVNVFFVPYDLKELKPQATYINALGVPGYLGQPDLPLLITEDDIVFTTDFDAKLSDLVKQIQGSARNRPYIATLYSPRHKIAPADVIMGLYKDAVKQGKHSPRACQRKGTCSRSTRAMKSPNAYAYASLAMLYSPDAAKYLRMHFVQAYFNDGAFQTHRDSPDVLINIFARYRFNCTRTQNCELYQAVPSMVEHVGAFSAIHLTANRRFHTTVNFPFEVAFPNVKPLDSPPPTSDGQPPASASTGNPAGAPAGANTGTAQHSTQSTHSARGSSTPGDRTDNEGGGLGGAAKRPYFQDNRPFYRNRFADARLALARKRAQHGQLLWERGLRNRGVGGSREGGYRGK